MDPSPSHPAQTFVRIMALVVAVMLPACSTYFEPAGLGFSATGNVAAPAPTLTTCAILRNAIVDEASLDASIDAHEARLEQNPDSPELWAHLANQYLLKGTAYSSGRDSKKQCFARAMQCAEQAMENHSAFKQQRLSGTPVWVACQELGPESLDTMLFWVTAVLYSFRESMSLIDKIRYADWILHADQVLAHMESLDRDWNGGAILFSRGIVRLALPTFKGGDRELGLQLLDEAVAMADDWMLPYWGRATYGYAFTGNAEQRRGDLDQVLQLDPALPREAPYWRQHFQDNARSTLRKLAPPSPREP